MDRVRKLAGAGERRVSLVEITGGEPLLQADTPDLCQRLLDDGFTAMIETSGERFIGGLPRAVIKIVDVRCPDSGEAGAFDAANLDAIGEKDEIKFVISTRRDYDSRATSRANTGLQLASMRFCFHLYSLIPPANGRILRRAN